MERAVVVATSGDEQSPQSQQPHKEVWVDIGDGTAKTADVTRRNIHRQARVISCLLGQFCAAHDAEMAAKAAAAAASSTESDSDSDQPPALTGDAALSDAAAKFSAVVPPGISVHAYVQRIREYLNASENVFVLCMIYVDRVTSSPRCPDDFTLNARTVHRLLLTGALLASKYLEDQPAHFRLFACIGGTAVSELAVLERTFASLLDYDFYVCPSVFESLAAELSGHLSLTAEEEAAAAASGVAPARAESCATCAAVAWQQAQSCAPIVPAPKVVAAATHAGSQSQRKAGAEFASPGRRHGHCGGGGGMMSHHPRMAMEFGDDVDDCSHDVSAAATSAAAASPSTTSQDKTFDESVDVATAQKQQLQRHHEGLAASPTQSPSSMRHRKLRRVGGPRAPVRRLDFQQ